MWNPLVAMTMLAAMAMNGVDPVPGGPPIVCLQDGEVKLGSGCDAVRMVLECVEMSVERAKDGAVQPNAPPVDLPLVEVRDNPPSPPQPPPVCSMLIP